MLNELELLTTIPKSKRINYLIEVKDSVQLYFDTFLDPTKTLISTNRTFRQNGQNEMSLEEFINIAFNLNDTLTERSKTLHQVMSDLSEKEYKWFHSLLFKENISGVTIPKLKEIFGSFYGCSYGSQVNIDSKDWTNFSVSAIKQGFRGYCVISNYMCFFYDSSGIFLTALDSNKLFISKLNLNNVVLIGQINSDALTNEEMYKTMFTKIKNKNTSIKFFIEDIVSLSEWGLGKSNSLSSIKLDDLYFNYFNTIKINNFNKDRLLVNLVPRTTLEKTEDAINLYNWAIKEQYNYLLFRSPQSSFCKGHNDYWFKVNCLDVPYIEANSENLI
jgi:hypothetical protein